GPGVAAGWPRWPWGGGGVRGVAAVATGWPCRGVSGAVAALKDERFQLAEFTQRQLRIQLARARLDDEGGYFCQLYTEDTHHQIATLTVLVPPDTPVVEVTEPAVEGGEVELSCVVPRSRPPATLRWYRDRRELKGGGTRGGHGDL
ncbi:cell adhesion molecule 4-like, partial [Oxyura jamaicensis]|uniref:cell adhesion molecule 4-like n=1 Tax=Oxyura jamaicensis TaxID=8884 RepID=UPI0015A4FAA9